MARPRYRKPGHGTYDPGPYPQNRFWEDEQQEQQTVRRPNRKEPAPRTLARDYFGETGNAMISNTEGLTAEAQEPYIDLVESAGWNLAIRAVFIPIIRKLRRELLHNDNLPEKSRLRDQGFLYFLALTLKELYSRAGEDNMPDALRKEFN